MTETASKKQNDKDVYIGDEFSEEEDSQGEQEVNELEGLYDLLIPPGVPESLIVELVDEFDLEPVTRLANVDIVEVDPRELMALRGDLEIVNEAHDYMVKRMHEITNGGYKSPWVDND
ncbi:MAG: hypothetical protein M8349_00910 [ANME-2 cluster archaeon]|nr:hypothetical protein [ANME-2 cluster archaeon]MDF1557269.1 hypothetical protein [ANME-2 cluster archaeon]